MNVMYMRSVIGKKLGQFFLSSLVGLPLLCGAMPDRFFAPYVDATLYPKFDIVSAAQNQGTLYYTLAFVVAAGDMSGQDPLAVEPSTLSAWGAQNTLRVNADYMKSDIAALRALGGDVMLSFGGAANIELAGLYSNPYSSTTQPSEYQQREDANVLHLKQAYQFVIDTYELVHIDFDIEGQWVAEPYSIQLRTKAIKALQDDATTAGRTLLVWYTLPALPSGLDGNGRNVLNQALAGGVDLAGINVMAMDYGASTAPIIDPATGHNVSLPNIPPRENDASSTGVDSNSTGMMGDYGIRAGQGLFNQLKTAYSNHGITQTDAQLWRKVGITPMLGVNDVQEEVIDLSEAAEIYQFALAQDIGMISFWSITRDHPAPAGKEGQVDAKHSGLNEPSYAFSHLFVPFSGDGSEAIYVSDASVEEGDVGTKTVEIRLWRLPVSSEVRVVNWTTVDDSATAPADYIAAAGSVTFAAGESEKMISLTLQNELLEEETEQFFVQFSTTSGVPIPDSFSAIIILDDDQPPTATITDKSVSESATTALFEVTLSRPVKAGLVATVDYVVDSGTAISGVDFLANSGTLSFSGMETTKSISVGIVGDSLEETDEVFVVQLRAPTNLNVSDSQGLGIIQDDDGTVTGGYEFHINDQWSTGWVGVLKATNPGPGNWDPWQLSFDSLWAAAFWNCVVNETLSTNDGNGKYHHVIDPPSWGGAVPPDGTFEISWTAVGSDTSAPTNVVVNGMVLTPLNQSPGVSVNDPTMPEGDAGSHTASFTVSLTEAASTPIYLSYAIVAGTASAGTDYMATNGTITFLAGETTQQIPLTILGDTTAEGDESVLLFLAGVDGESLPRITDSQGIMTISGDDWMPSLTTSTAIVKEQDSGTQSAMIRVRLNRAAKEGESIRVDYQTADITATAGSDYQANSGTLVFAKGESEKTLSLVVNGDTLDERLERFELIFSTPVGCLLSDDRVEVQVIDNDTSGSLGTQRVIAYVYGGGLLPPAHQVTHINYAFSNLNADGSWAFSGNLASLHALRVQNPNLKLLVSIGGWGWSENFSSVADDPVKRTTFAQSAAQLIQSQNLDGVDIDWEWPGAQGDGDTPPGPRDRTNFTLLMQETRDAIDALGVANNRSYLLTAFTGAGAAQIAGLELAQIGAIFDYINVQGYDLHGSWDAITGHASGLHHNPSDTGGVNLNIESILNIYEAAGIPRDKLLIGAAFYARTFNGANAANHGLFQSHSNWGATPLYRQLLTGALTSSRYFWDDIAKVPWLYNDTTGEFVTFDDPRSCAEKSAYSRDNGYGGVYFWQMGGDTSDFHLLTALYDTSAEIPGADSDADGMDDVWEQTHFGNLTDANQQTDWDQDGVSDLDEFYAGTHPKNAADFFHILSFVTENDRTITWSFVNGKTYRVEYAPTLQSNTWVTLDGNFSVGSFTETNALRLNRPIGFYRIRLP